MAPLSSADTFQYLSGLHLSHILLTHTFYILFIFLHNQSLCSQVNCSALLPPFSTLSSSPRAGAPKTRTPFHGCSLCSGLLDFNTHGLADSLLSSGYRNKRQAQPKILQSNLDIWTTQENVVHGIWKQKQRERQTGAQEHTNTIPRIIHVFH